MFLFLSALVSCNTWVEYVPINISKPQIQTKIYPKQVFENIQDAEPYLLLMILDKTKVQQIISEMADTNEYSVVIKSITGNEGSHYDHLFTLHNLILSITKDTNGNIIVSFGLVDASCNVHTEQILHTEYIIKKFYGIIKKNKRSIQTLPRPMKADEIENVINVLENAASETLNSVIKEVKNTISN